MYIIIIIPSVANTLPRPPPRLAPTIFNLDSDDAFPPNTFLFCTATTFAPFLAVDNAAETPADPHPAHEAGHYPIENSWLQPCLPKGPWVFVP